MFGGSFIPLQYFRRDGVGQILVAHEIQIEVLNAYAASGRHVERQIGSAPTLAEQTFVFHGSFANGRPDPDPHAAIEPYRCIQGRLDGHYSHRATQHHPLLHRHRRQRQNVPVPMNVRQPCEQLVIDRQRCARAVIPHSNQHDARLPVSRQVIRERADIPTNLLGVGGRIPSAPPSRTPCLTSVHRVQRRNKLPSAYLCTLGPISAVGPMRWNGITCMPAS